MADDLLFDPLYPDVLGAITSERVQIGDLQVAVGVFPRSAYLNQPIEVIMVTQNTLDMGLKAQLALQLPARDRAGRALRLETPRKTLEWTMKPGEVGVLRLPILPLAPTPAGEHYPLRVQVRASRARVTGRLAKTMRPPTGGAPPSVLALSSFKLQALRDVEYVRPPGNEGQADAITAYFDIADQRLPAPTTPPKVSYEVLWTAEQMPAERQHIAERIDEARLLLASFTMSEVYPAMLEKVDDVFAANGMPLHPGEAKAIAKMVTFVFDNNLSTDPTYHLEEQRWFQQFTQTLAYNPAVATWPPGDIASRYLFEAALYDAVLMAFTLIRPRVRANLGDKAERMNYADRILRWTSGQGEPDLAYIYLPLVMGGLAVNSYIVTRGDDPWRLLDDIRDAQRGRVRLAAGSAGGEVFDLVETLIQRSEDDLRRARILPGG